jgi:hypothetical protein
MSEPYRTDIYITITHISYYFFTENKFNLRIRILLEELTLGPGVYSASNRNEYQKH